MSHFSEQKLPGPVQQAIDLYEPEASDLVSLYTDEQILSFTERLRHPAATLRLLAMVGNLFFGTLLAAFFGAIAYGVIWLGGIGPEGTLDQVIRVGSFLFAAPIIFASVGTFFKIAVFRSIYGLANPQIIFSDHFGTPAYRSDLTDTGNRHFRWAVEQAMFQREREILGKQGNS